MVCGTGVSTFMIYRQVSNEIALHTVHGKALVDAIMIADTRRFIPGYNRLVIDLTLLDDDSMTPSNRQPSIARSSKESRKVPTCHRCLQRKKGHAIHYCPEDEAGGVNLTGPVLPSPLVPPYPMPREIFTKGKLNRWAAHGMYKEALSDPEFCGTNGKVINLLHWADALGKGEDGNPLWSRYEDWWRSYDSEGPRKGK